MINRIKTRHPEGKDGVSIEKHKYDLIRQAILDAIGQRVTIPFQELRVAVVANLHEPLEGSIGWYTTAIKLDLEARGEIERIPGRYPQELRLTTSSLIA